MNRHSVAREPAVVLQHPSAPASVLDALDALLLLRRDERAASTAASEQSPVAILDVLARVDGQDAIRRLIAEHGAQAVQRWVRLFTAEAGEAV